MTGITPTDTHERRHLLAEHLDQLIEGMKHSGIASPVGLVVDATDKMGSVFYRAALMKSGMTVEEADRQLAETAAQMAERQQYPTVTLVISWALAEQLLPRTSPTARKNLREMKTQYGIGRGGRCLVIAIGSGGNSYGVVDIPELPRTAPTANDGQHRHKAIHFFGR